MAISKWNKFVQGFLVIMMGTALFGMLLDIAAGNIPHAMSWLAGIFFGSLIYKLTER